MDFVRQSYCFIFY